jgi:hypothetical protein
VTSQIVQVAGALAILAAFALVQRRTLSTTSPSYLLLNLAGGASTAAAAYVEVAVTNPVSG